MMAREIEEIAKDVARVAGGISLGIQGGGSQKHVVLNWVSTLRNAADRLERLAGGGRAGGGGSTPLQRPSSARSGAGR